MRTEETLRALDDLIHARSILQHPFYRAWQRGELTPDQLATYSRVYYPHVAAFTAYLEHRASERAALARCLDAGTSPGAVMNAAEEALDAYCNLLNGVCEEAEVPLTEILP